MRFHKLILLFTISLFLTPYAAASSAELEAARLLEAEVALAKLGYWVLNIDGKPDASTRHAITAFQKVEGLKRTGQLTPELLELLRNAAKPAPQYQTGAAHVEVDMKRQVLFYVDAGGNIDRILAVSTGSDKKYVFEGKSDVAHTPRGEFKIYAQIDNIREAPLGTIYYPSYFNGGIAIHGSDSIPIFPASHGCVRVPRYADQALNHMLSIGMKVYVYDDNFLTRAPGENNAGRTNWFTPVPASLFQPADIFSRSVFAKAPTLFEWNTRPMADTLATYAFQPSLPGKFGFSNV